jgi:hypothetical protein
MWLFRWGTAADGPAKPTRRMRSRRISKAKIDLTSKVADLVGVSGGRARPSDKTRRILYRPKGNALFDKL